MQGRSEPGSLCLWLRFWRGQGGGGYHKEELLPVEIPMGSGSPWGLWELSDGHCAFSTLPAGPRGQGRVVQSCPITRKSLAPPGPPP